MLYARQLTVLLLCSERHISLSFHQGIFATCVVGIAVSMVLAWHTYFVQKYINSYRELHSNLTSSAPLIALESLSRTEIWRMRLITIGAMFVSVLLGLSGSLFDSTEQKGFRLNEGQVSFYLFFSFFVLLCFSIGWACSHPGVVPLYSHYTRTRRWPLSFTACRI